MKKQKSVYITLYTIEGIDFDAVIAKYRQLCEEGEKEIDANSISVYGNVEPKYTQVRKPRKPLNDDIRILNKAIYLVHTIAYRQATNREENVEGVFKRLIGFFTSLLVSFIFLNKFLVCFLSILSEEMGKYKEKFQNYRFKSGKSVNKEKNKRPGRYIFRVLWYTLYIKSL